MHDDDTLTVNTADELPPEVDTLARRLQVALRIHDWLAHGELPPQVTPVPPRR